MRRKVWHHDRKCSDGPCGVTDSAGTSPHHFPCISARLPGRALAQEGAEEIVDGFPHHRDRISALRALRAALAGAPSQLLAPAGAAVASPPRTGNLTRIRSSPLNSPAG